MNQSQLLLEAQQLGQALSAGSRDPQLYFRFALVNQRLGRMKEAEDAFRQACELRPKNPEFLNAWGVHLMSQQRRDEGIALFHRAAQVDAKYVPSYRHLGVAYLEQNKSAEAEKAVRQWLGMEPDSPDALQLLGRALGKAGRFDEAIAAFTRCLQVDASNVEATHFLGVALRKQRRLEEATEPLRRSTAARPDDLDMLGELANNYADLGDHRTALMLLDRILMSKPNDADLHGQRAQSLLYLGEYAAGWREYEWRWKSSGFPHNRRHTNLPQWSGSDIAGKSILIHTEQGFGDVFQFARYVPLVAARGARVLLQSNHGGVMDLLRTLEGVSQFFEPEQLVPKTDFQCPLISLPLVFGTTLQTIPAQVPYFHALPGRIERWQPRLETPPGVRKIGLFWRGRTNSLRSAERALSPSMLAPLASVPNARFFSLQKSKGSEQAIEGLELVRLDADLKDFADTAAVISQLDLVITIDSAVAHLAGALGKPVWTLVSLASDFRWMLDREDSPWYPTMRLFRQKRRGDWAEVVERVMAELKSGRLFTSRVEN